MRASIPYDPRYTERISVKDREEIVQQIRNNLSTFDATNEEIQKLSIECVSNLTTSRALSYELSKQSSAKRLWYDFIGRNQHLQSAINRSHAHSMYASQQLLILLMEQNKASMQFSLYLDQKQHIINLDFSEQISQQNQDIQRACQTLQKHDMELNKVAFECSNCRTRLQRDSVICPRCGRKHTQIVDLLKTDPARDAYQLDKEALSDIVSHKSLTTGAPLQAAYDFARLCNLPEQLQEQLDAIYADTAERIDALKISKSRLLQHFQKNKLSQRDAYCTKFIQEAQSIIRNEKDMIDETLDQFDHLDNQTKQLEYAIENLKKQCGGEE